MPPIFTAKRVSVPGLLSDEGLAVAVKGLQTQVSGTPVPASSQIGVPQKIIDLGVTMPAPRAAAGPISQAPVSLSGAGPAAAPQAAPQLQQSRAAPGFGMLTADQAAEEQTQRIAAAEADVKAVEADNALGEQLRNITDEQAAEFGIPRDPFASPEEAAATRARLAQQDADYLAQTQERADFVKESPPPTMTWWLDAAQVGARAAAQTGTSALKYPFSAFEALTYLGTGYETGKTAPRGWLDEVDGALNKILPGDPSRAKDFVSELSAGGGSFVPFLLAGYLGAAVGLPAGITAGGLGAAATGNQMYEEAESFNASMFQKSMALFQGSALGASEAIPIDRMFMRADHATGGLVRRMIANTAASTVEEFTQEFSQAIGEDMIAKYGAGYDPDRQLDMMSWLRQGAIGGIVGGAAGGVTTALPGPRQEPPEAAQVAAVEEVLNREQARFDQIVGVDPSQEGVDAQPAGSEPALAASSQQPGAAAGQDGVAARPTDTRVEPIVIGDAVQAIRRAAVPQAATQPVERQVSVSQARALEMTPQIPADPLFAEAAANTEGATLTDEGLIIDLVRYQKEEQSGSTSVRTGVFYLPTGSATAKHYKGGKNGYGGRVEVRGETLLKRPLFVKGATGGKAPEAGYDLIKGKGAYSAMRDDALKVVMAPKNLREEAGYKFLEQYGADGGLIYDILPASTQGNTLAYALQENVVAHAVREAGYDAVVGHSKAGGKTVVSEVFDVREIDYPTPGEPATLHPDFEQQVANPLIRQIAAAKPTPQDLKPLPSLGKPDPLVVKTAQAYAEAVGLPIRRQTATALQTPARAELLAQAYADMADQPTDPAVLSGYRALADEVAAQYAFATAAGANLAADPAIVYPAGHPLAEPVAEGVTAGQALQALHQYFGRGREGASDPENMWRAHAVMFSDSALPAMTAETLAFTTYEAVNGEALGRKTGLLSSKAWGESSLYDAPAAVENMVSGTSSTRMPYTAEPVRPQRGVPDANPGTVTENDDVKLTQISRNFTKLLNLTVRHGRLAARNGNIMGEYNRSTATIRLRVWSDLSTLVHEGGHALNDSMAKPLNDFVQRNAAEIMRIGVSLYAGDLSNAPAATRMREGFAEFFRVYTLTPDFARNKYPAVVADFETTLRNTDPAVLDGLGAIATQFKAWLQLPSAKLIRNMVVDGRREQGINAAIKELKDLGFKSWFEEHTRRSVEWSVNRFAPLNRLVMDLLNQSEAANGKALDLARADDPRTLIRLARNSGARAMVEVTDGVYGYRSTQPMSRGLRDALMISQGVDPRTTPGSLNEERMKDFSAYLVARRSLDEYRRFDEGKIDRPPIGASLGDVRRAIADYETQYGQSFTEAAAIAHEFGMALWQKQYDAGLMAKETYEDGLERQFYVPLQRDMSDKKASFGPNALTTGSPSLVKRFRGSDRDIVDPMAVLMQKAFALETLISENEVIRTLALLADKVGRAGALVERIPASQVLGMTMSVEDAARQLSKDDTLTAADAQDLMTLLGASIKEGNAISLYRREQVSTSGENILFFWENGKPAAIQLKDGDLGADVINTLSGVGRENLPLFTGLITGVSSAFRTAITSWPDFLVVNYIRDQMSAWILNDVGFVPFASGIRGMVDEVRQKQWAKSYNAAQGIMGGMNVAALHEANIDRDITALRSKGYIAQAFRDKTPMLGAIRGFAEITALSETGTRLGIYRGAYNRAKADNLTDYEASVEAGYTATDYMDFGLNGSRMTFYRRTVPFLNAQLQGLYKMMRVLGADEVAQRKGLKFVLGAYFKGTRNMPMSRVERDAVNTGRKAWVKMASLGMLSALLHFLFRDDPDYQEAGEYLRVTGWVIPMGDGRVFYIPKPFELALMANAVERGLEYASGDSQAPGRFLRGAALALIPPTTPTSTQLITELSVNKDFFTGKDIVPTYMQALEPRLQYDNYTSSLAKWMGDQFNWSPLVVDHVLSGLGASAYRDIATMTNAADPTRPSLDNTDMPLLRRFVRDVRRGSVSAQDFWSQASNTTGRLEQASQSYKRLIEYGNDLGANEFLSGLSSDEKAYALLMTHYDVDAKRLNPFYRARQVTTVVSGMRRELVSSLGLGDTTLKDFPGAFTMTPGQKQQVDEVLSEIARREVRNTLIATKQAGWADKDILPLEPTLDLLLAVSPDTYDEYQRRYTKRKIYNADAVFEYWPEVRDRLLQDGEYSVLSDVVSVAGVVF